MATTPGPRRTGDMSLDRLFVYGTLRPHSPAFELVRPAVVRHQPAVLTGYSLVAEGHRYPWCVESAEGEVAGDLLWLEEVEGTLRRLDEYEGVHDPDPEYVRSVADVLVGSSMLPAWVYVGGACVAGDVHPLEGTDWIP